METNFQNLKSSMIAIDSCNVSQAAVHVNLINLFYS